MKFRGKTNAKVYDSLMVKTYFKHFPLPLSCKTIFLTIRFHAPYFTSVSGDGDGNGDSCHLMLKLIYV